MRTKHLICVRVLYLPLMWFRKGFINGRPGKSRAVKIFFTSLSCAFACVAYSLMDSFPVSLIFFSHGRTCSRNRGFLFNGISNMCTSTSFAPIICVYLKQILQFKVWSYFGWHSSFESRVRLGIYRSIRPPGKTPRSRGHIFLSETTN